MRFLEKFVTLNGMPQTIEMVQAAKAGDVGLIKKMLDAGPELAAAKDEAGVSALMLVGPQANIAGLVGRWVGAGERFRIV